MAQSFGLNHLQMTGLKWLDINHLRNIIALLKVKPEVTSRLNNLVKYFTHCLYLTMELYFLSTTNLGRINHTKSDIRNVYSKEDTNVNQVLLPLP